MKMPPLSSTMIITMLALGGCAQTQITEHAAQVQQTSLPIEQLGQTLLVIENALPQEDRQTEKQMDEFSKTISDFLGKKVGAIASTNSDDQLLAQARNQGLDSVTIVRIEDYARHGSISVTVALPPVSWETHTLISLRVRVLETKTGLTQLDLRQDRKNGGPMAFRSAQDLPEELQKSLSLIFGKAG